MIISNEAAGLGNRGKMDTPLTKWARYGMAYLSFNYDAPS